MVAGTGRILVLSRWLEVYIVSHGVTRGVVEEEEVVEEEDAGVFD